jgi:hypothetical protein
MKQQIMFTACPNGRSQASGGLMVSVLISPKLDPEGNPQRLDTFPDFLDWPGKAIQWRVSVGGGAPINANVMSPAASSNLWTGLFSADTLVRGHVHADYSKHLWWSYPVGHVIDFINNLYQQIALSHPEEFPPVELLKENKLEEISHYQRGQDRRPELRRLFLQKLRQDRALPPAAPNAPEDFFQLWNFHQPGNLATPPTVPTFDFHEAVALCGEHFGLMRQLGLVVDLEVPGTFANGNSAVQIQPVWSSDLGINSRDVLPITNCVIGAGSFLPRPKNAAELVNGRLPLDGNLYRTVQVDPDGGALNLMMLGRNLVQSTLFKSEDTPTSEALPSLRSGGISIARTGHAAQLVGQVDDGNSFNNAMQGGDAIIFHAENLWRGTRFDIWDDASGQWHSLHQRRGSYNFTGLGEEVIIQEEGAMIEAPTERDEENPDPSADKFLYMQESLMRWDGWSLAASRPGRTVDQENQVIDGAETPADGFPLVMDFKAAAGSLPRLRYGRTYMVRARMVDPAGNSVPFDQSSASATPRFTYRRYEPIVAPFVLLTAPRTEGESDALVVLRSDYNENPAPGNVQRIIAPPRVDQRTAEYHGMWDGQWGTNPAAIYAQIIAREARGFHEPGFGTPDPDNYDQPYFPQTPVPIEYLPDPMARGAAMRFIPRQGTQQNEQISYEKGGNWPAVWPEAKPIRLILEEGALGAPGVNAQAEETQVRYRLPKGETAQVRLSSYPVAGDLALSAIWAMIESSSASAAVKEARRAQILQGRHWMISPFRTLRLVHAVRRPLKPPAFQANSWAVTRQAGETFARLSGLLDFSRKSTSRVDLHASWNEPVDLGKGNGAGAPDPRLGANMRHHEAWLEIPLTRMTDTGGQLEDMLPVSGRRHEFNDTKRRIVTYTARATSAFTEYFQKREKNVPVSANNTVVLPSKPIVEGSELVRASGDGPSFAPGVDYEMDYVNGQLTWLGSPATVDIVYLPEPTTRHSSEAPAAERSVTLDIPSSARPQTPKVLYVVPTHRWLSMALGSKAEGGGLRVYLDRPFFDTGEGQLLGVVLPPPPVEPGARSSHEHLAPYTTGWGFDPIKGPPAPATQTPRTNQFPLAAAGGTSTNRILAETGDTVHVVGHAVGFDDERKLWYCDIEVDAGKEVAWPFIRLALASYQPHSVGNLHLSPVVLADIVQLTPDRTATLQFKGAGLAEVKILGPGQLAAAQAGVTQITAHVEAKLAEVSDPELAWEAVGSNGNRIVLRAQRDPGGLVAWVGDIQLPTARAGDQQPLRVVIEEWEILSLVEGEAENGLFLPLISGGAGQPTDEDPYRGQQPRNDRRLLYRDFIPLNDPAG